MDRVVRVVMMLTGLVLGWATLAAAQERTVLVSEMRIGNVATQPGQAWYGDFEYDLGTNTAAPAAKGQFAWPNNQPVPFEIKYDASVKYAWLQVSADPAHTIEYDLGTAPFTPGALTTLRFGGRAMAPNSRLLVSDMVLEPDGQAAQALTNVFEILPADGYRSAFLGGLPLGGGFKLRGEVLIQWDETNPPGRSQLAVQMGMAEPPQVVSVQWEQHVKLLTDNPATHGGGVRIFAERDDPAAQPSAENQTVIVKATVVPRRAGVRVYFASYDVDDPTANTAPVDAMDEQFSDRGNDNRGAPQNGSFVNGVSFADTDVNGEACLRLVVTTNPGDNFRVAATLDENELQKLGIYADDPDSIYVPASGESVLDGFTGRVSPLLTVWRNVHFELDSMGPMPLEDSVVQGFVVRVETPQKILTDVDLTFGGKDKSPNLDDLAQEALGYRGRFDKGDVLIGTRLTKNLYGNGQHQLRCQVTDRFDLPFTITKHGVQLAAGQINRLELAVDTTRITLDLIEGSLSDACVGGTLNLCGEEATVTGVAVATAGVSVDRVIKLPLQLRDDDGMFVPADPDVSTLSAALDKAFVVPQFNTPGVAKFNSKDRPFMLNMRMLPVPYILVQGWGSERLNGRDFWVVYMQTAYQGGTYSIEQVLDVGGQTRTITDADLDSGREGAILGWSSWGGIVLLSEPAGEVAGSKPAADTVVHEVGHTLARNSSENITDGRSRYTEEYLDSLRCTPGPRSRFW